MASSHLKYVTASAANSCVPACLAMVTGKTLKQVLHEMYEYWESDGVFTGVEDDVMDQYLAQNGYAVQRIKYEYEPNKLLVDGWPIDPFAPLHIVDVWSSDPAGMHSIVMGADGKIMDPSNKAIKSIHEYQRVFAIAGLWKVTGRLIDIIE